MIHEIQTQIDQYTKWLKEKTVLREIKDTGYIAVSTPYIDRHNDCIDIYIKCEDGRYFITDDGYTLDDLEQSGCMLGRKGSKRQQLLSVALNGLGVNLRDGALTITTPKEKFPQAKHSLVQAILTVNDMFYVSQPTVKSLFLEDVAKWLDDSDIRYSRNIPFVGKTNYVHRFDFLIPKSRTKPERIIRALNNPSRDTAESFAFAWLDSRKTRPDDAQAYAIMNDTDGPIKNEVINALESYEIIIAPWSRNNDYVQDLAA